jgi:Bacterial PH domain
MRTPLVRPRSPEQSSPFERLKRNLETVDCDTGVFWRSELRRLAPLLAPDEKVEAIVSASHTGDPALAAITDARLIVVSEARVESIPHGATTQLAATIDWAGDFKLTFVCEGRDVVLTDITEDDGRRLYACLRVGDRVPEVAAGGKGISKLAVTKAKSSWYTDAFPDPTRGLDIVRRRWMLKSVDESGPNRRSLPWIAHSLFVGTAIVVGIAVAAVVILLVVAIVAVVVYVLTAD